MLNFQTFIDKNAEAYSLKFPEGKANLQIVKLVFKMQKEYVLVYCKVPNVEKDKLILFYGYGQRPRKNLFHGKVFHQEKTIVLKKIERIYNLFHLFEEVKEEQCEIREIRSRGINFYYNQLCLDKGEEFFYNYLKYSYNELVPFKKEEEIKSPVKSKKELIDVIYRTKICNLKELEQIFTDVSISLLKELCIYFKGRFVLKNDFYESRVQKVRTEFLNHFKVNDFITLLDAEKILKREMFILDEFCFKKNNVFFLKGYNEMLSLKEEELEIFDENNKILFLLKKHKMISYDKLMNETGLSFKDISLLLKDNIILLSNSCIALKSDNEIQNNILSLFKNRRVIRKSELIKEINTNNKCTLTQIEEVIEEFCEEKGPNLVLKNDTLNE